MGGVVARNEGQLCGCSGLVGPDVVVLRRRGGCGLQQIVIEGLGYFELAEAVALVSAQATSRS